MKGIIYRPKQGVTMSGLHWCMKPAIIMAGVILNNHRIPLVITETTEGCHDIESKHPEGKAIDIRTRDMTNELAREVWDEIYNELSAVYDVVLESNHLHIEWRY